MIVIISNKKGVTHLSAMVVLAEGQKPVPVSKVVYPGSNIIDDPGFEDAIQKSPDFKGWCEAGIFETQAFAKKKDAPNKYASIPVEVMKKSISKSAQIKELEEIIANDDRPQVSAAARDRLEVLKKPEMRDGDAKE